MGRGERDEVGKVQASRCNVLTGPGLNQRECGERDLGAFAFAQGLPVK